MKKKILAAALAVLLVAVAGYGTLAYFTATGKATNIITAATLGIKINEYANDDDPSKPENGVLIAEGAGGTVDGVSITIKKDGIVPGDIVSKIPKVENTETIDAWVRVKVTVSCTDAEGVALSADPIEINYNTGSGATQWTLGTDGNYYYNGIVAPQGETGDETAQLFSTVTFDLEDTDNTYQGATVTITLDAQAVQSGNNGATVMAAGGWPSFS